MNKRDDFTPLEVSDLKPEIFNLVDPGDDDEDEDSSTSAEEFADDVDFHLNCEWEDDEDDQ